MPARRAGGPHRMPALGVGETHTGKKSFRARGDHHPNLPFVVHARHRDGQSAGPMAAVERSVGNVPRAVVLGCQLPIKQLRASCQAGAHSFQRTTGARLQGGPLCISLTPILLNTRFHLDCRGTRIWKDRPDKSLNKGSKPPQPPHETEPESAKPIPINNIERWAL